MTASRIPCLVAFLIGMGCAAVCDSQNRTHDGLWNSIRRALLPDIQAEVYELREFIADMPGSPAGDTTSEMNGAVVREPSAQRRRDLAKLDSIYFQAVYLSEGKTPEALILCALATLPYRIFPAIIPLVQMRVMVPISTESEDAFRRRRSNLPAMLLADSPPEGDRDKLPHFFGSAFLFLATKNEAFVTTIGAGVELFESIFKLEGFYDPRDIAADQLGVAFGKALMENEDTLPSTIFSSSIPTPHDHEQGTDSRR